MFEAVAVPAVGGFRAQVRREDTSEVLWESTEIYTDDKKGKEGTIYGNTIAENKAREVINTVFADLFKNAKA